MKIPFQIMKAYIFILTSILYFYINKIFKRINLNFPKNSISFEIILVYKLPCYSIVRWAKKYYIKETHWKSGYIS